MRLAIGLFIVFLLPVVGSAGEGEELRDKAIRAMAGTPEKLNALKNYSSKATGTMLDKKASREIRMSWPDTFRLDSEVKDGRFDVKVRVLLHGSRGFTQVVGRPVEEMSPAEVTAQNNDLVYALWLSNLFPLLEKGVTIKLVPEIKLPGGPAQGMKVSAPGRPDALIYFDKQTTLLVKIALPGKENDLKILREIDFGKHKEVDGIKLPFEETESHSGVKAVTWSISEIKLPEKFDPGILKP